MIKTYETSKYGEIVAARISSGYFIINGKVNLTLEIAEEEFLEAINVPPAEIEAEDLLTGLTQSAAKDPNALTPGNYYIFHIRQNEKIKPTEYIKYKAQLYRVEFIKESDTIKDSIRVYCS